MLMRTVPWLLALVVAMMELSVVECGPLHHPRHLHLSSNTTRNHQYRPPIKSGHHAHDTYIKGNLGREENCSVCPAVTDVAPCKCTCLNSTMAEVSCGPELASCSQLTDVLTLTAFPVNLYIRLIVEKTMLDCMLEEDLWGPVKFREIHLVNNQFHTVDNHAFLPFNDTLTLLNLESNSLENVYFPALSEVPYLEVLSFAHNHISFLPGFYPMSLGRLKTLSLAYNQLLQVQQMSFAELPELKMLDLSHNLLTRIYPDAFAIPGHQAANLYIDLSHNSLSAIEEGVLVGPKTCYINLQYNNLPTLDEAIFRPIIDSCGSNSYISVADNPFTCDERLCWIVTNQTVSQTFDPIRCPNLNNLLLDVLEPLCALKPTSFLS